MTCPLGHAVQHTTIPHPLTSAPMDLLRCETCKRQYAVGLDGIGRWLRMPGYCGGCDGDTWRMLTHPTRGHRELLWPKPETVFAFVLTPDGPGTDVWNDYCPACCPALGAAPRRIVAEVNGAPLVTTVCHHHETAHAKYAHLFSDQFGRWLAAHLIDGYGVSEGERDALVAQWQQDRAA